MPKINEVLHTPDEAAAKGCCPECGRDMAISDAENEIRLHWPRGLDPNVASEEAIYRAKLLRANFAPKAEPKP